jgi:hypothetical protein
MPALLPAVLLGGPSCLPAGRQVGREHRFFGFNSENLRPKKVFKGLRIKEARIQ